MKNPRLIIWLTAVNTFFISSIVRADDTIPDILTFNSAILIVANTLRMTAYGLAVAAIIYAGILYLTAYGDESKPNQAKTVFKSALLGLALVLLAQVVVITVINPLTSATTVDEVGKSISNIFQSNQPDKISK